MKIGDRVKYIGTFTPELTGKTGTIIEIEIKNIYVDWDQYKHDSGVLPQNLEIIESVTSKPIEASTTKPYNYASMFGAKKTVVNDLI